MKRLVVKLSALVALITIFILPLTISASAASAYDVSDFAFKTVRDNSEIVVFDNQSLNLMSKRMRVISDEEKLNKILAQCNVPNAAHLDTVKKLAENFDAIAGVTSSTEYIKVDKNGNQTVMSKSECLKAVEGKNYSKGDGRESENHYMYISTIIIQISKEYQPQGTYCVISSALWLKSPTLRARDAFSVGSRFITWEGINSGNYEGRLFYDLEQKNYATGQRSVTELAEEKVPGPKKVLDEEGFFFEFLLPKNSYSTVNSLGVKNGIDMTYSNINIVISGMGKVIYPDVSQNISVTSTYAHMRLGIDLDFEFTWDAEGWGVSVPFKFKIFEDEYLFYFPFEYFPNI